MNKKIREASKEEIKQASCNYKPIAIKRRNAVERLICIDTGEVSYINNYGLYDAELENLGLEWRLYNANKQKQIRLKKRVDKMVKTNKAVFLTMTFNDYELSITNFETRKKYIKRYLKSQCLMYVANVDYGKQKNREHYHALVVPINDKLDLDAYRVITHSSINAKRVCTSNFKTSLKIAKYINKLTNHSLKTTGCYQRLIYSRK